MVKKGEKPSQTPRTPFMLQIVDADGVLLTFRGGGPLEIGIAEACAKEIAPMIAFVSTRKQREAAILEGVKSVIWKLKLETAKVT